MARHGVYIQEEATKIFSMVQVDSALPVVVGTAPVHTLPDDKLKPINELRLIFNLEDYVAQFGHVPEGEDRSKYSLSEFAEVYLGLYKVSPVVFINVFDPEKHNTPKQGEGGDLTTPDVSKVTKLDIIGGIDGPSLKRTGLELVSSVFPKFRMIPGQVLAPGFSSDPEVALILGTKCADINGHFSCVAPIDIPLSLKNYTEVPEWLKDNNLTAKTLIPFFGQASTGDKIEWGSTHFAGAMARRDADNEGIPYWSPSNSPLLANSLLHNGEELLLESNEAAWLNHQGCVTGLNFTGGLKIWGNHTAAYPGITDVKDVFIPVRRMFSYVGNTLVLSTWPKVDEPIVRVRHIESIVESINLWLNGLARREKLIAGKVNFLTGDNPTTDIMAGKVRYRIALTPASPAQEIIHILHYDHEALTSLFEINQGVN